MRGLLLVIALACWAGACRGQVFSWGKCPSPTVHDNFDITKYAGKWYENRRYFAIFEAFTGCTTAEYTLLDGGRVKVNNTGYSYVSNEMTTAIGDAQRTGDNPAKLGVTFSPTVPRGDYWVLSTDYDSYSVVWSCSSLAGYANYQFAWILTRKPEGVSGQKIKELESLMTGFGIQTKDFLITKQTNCGRY